MIFIVNFLLWLLVFVVNANGSHFRGGIFMARPQPGGLGNEMEIFYLISWRRSHPSGEFCNSTMVKSGQLIGDRWSSGRFTCYPNCSQSILENQSVNHYGTHFNNLTYQCTDFSVNEDWVFGERKLLYKFPNATIIKVGFSACCWIHPFSGNWSLFTTFSTEVRSDIGVINSTPRAATSPVIRVQAGCTRQIKLVVSDPDGDIVKCRWGVGSECYDVCGGFPGASIDNDTCTISYTANQGPGYKVAAVAIEDFQTSSSNTPFSTVVLQFLVLVFESNESCSASPYFVSPPTLKQGTCVAVKTNATFSTIILADSNSPSISISEISTISPSGTIKGSLQHIFNSSLFNINMTWLPSTSQYDQTHVLCYTAVSSTGTTSEQICIQLHPGISPPEPDNTTLLPVNNGTVNPLGNITWSLNFDKPIERPLISTLIKFHNTTNGKVVYTIDTSSSTEVMFNDSKLSITPNHSFTAGESFYITFEAGIVRSLEGCGPGNEAVINETFWIFKVQIVEEDIQKGLDEFLIPAVIAICVTFPPLTTCCIIIVVVVCIVYSGLRKKKIKKRKDHLNKPLTKLYQYPYDRRSSALSLKGTVYSIRCKTCGKAYIGEMETLSLSNIVSEHINNVKAQDQDDPISLHVLETGHEMDWNSCKVIATEEGYYQRMIIQQMYIQRTPRNLNLLRVNPLYQELQHEGMDLEVIFVGRDGLPIMREAQESVNYLKNNMYIEQ